MKNMLTTGLVIIGFVIAISLIGAYFISYNSASIGNGNKIAVINLDGPIQMSPEGSSFISGEGTTSGEFISQINRAVEDNSVKAIVIDVNSPGGSVVASEEMSSAVKKAENKKPVVAWLGEIAASGGYFVASASNYIVADPATITGSIGVISIFPEYSKLFKKIGLNMTVIKAGKYKDFSTGFRPFTGEERAMMQRIVNETYNLFIKDVSQNRNLSESYVRSIAGGRVYSGTDAVKLRLADKTGSFEYAVKKAAELGGIKGKPQIVTYRKKPGLLRDILGSSFENFGYGFAKGMIGTGIFMTEGKLKF